MAREIRHQLLEKEEKRRLELVAREVEVMEECTFKPNIPQYRPTNNSWNSNRSLSFGNGGLSPSATMLLTNLYDESYQNSNSHNHNHNANPYFDHENSASYFDENKNNLSMAGSIASSGCTPVIVRGLSRHIELKKLSLKQKDEAEKREAEAFSVKNVDKYRRGIDGSTIVKVGNNYQLCKSCARFALPVFISALFTSKFFSLLAIYLPNPIRFTNNDVYKVLIIITMIYLLAFCSEQYSYSSQ